MPLNTCKQRTKHVDEDATRKVVTETNLKGLFQKAQVEKEQAAQQHKMQARAPEDALRTIALMDYME